MGLSDWTFANPEYKPKHPLQSKESSALFVSSSSNDLTNPDKPVHPTIVELQGLIEINAEIYVVLREVLAQLPTSNFYLLDPIGRPTDRDYHEMLRRLDAAITTLPAYPGPGRILTDFAL